MCCKHWSIRSCFFQCLCPTFSASTSCAFAVRLTCTLPLVQFHACTVATALLTTSPPNSLDWPTVTPTPSAHTQDPSDALPPDIHHILRDRAVYGYYDLKSTSQSILASLDAFHSNQFDHNLLHKPDAWDNMHQLRRIACAAVSDDPFVTEPGQPPESRLFKMHPWLCGIIQSHLLSAYHQCWLTADHWQSVVASCHWYEAAKREGFLKDMSWFDLEYVMRMHGKAAMFRGKIPTDSIEASMQLHVMRGASAAISSGGAQHSQAPAASAKWAGSEGNDIRCHHQCRGE